MPTDKQQLQQQVEEMKAKLAEMEALLHKPESTINYWQPKHDEKYYFVDQYGDTKWNHYDQSTLRNSIRYRVFKTETEAQKYANYIKAEETIHKAVAEANQGWLPNWSDANQKKYILFLNTRYNKLEIDWFKRYKRSINFVYIKSEELAKQLAKDYEQEFRTYLSY